jgi:cytochrome bd-type quinol oxidase subunit 2
MVSANAMYIAQFISVIFLVMSFAIFFNADAYKKLIGEYVKSPALMNFAGFSSLVIGFLILKHHNNWEYNWSIVITLFGCISFVKGVMLVAFPNVLMNIFNLKQITTKYLRIESVVMFAVSLALGYFGFGF